MKAIAILDQEKLKTLSDALSSKLLAAHDSWNDPAKLQAAKEKCKAENEARKNR